MAEDPEFDDPHHSPLSDLAYEPLWSTRDVAEFFDVSAATVRTWVHRGHLAPAGKAGPSHVFERDSVFAAADAVEARRRSRADPADASAGPPADPLQELWTRRARREPRGHTPDPTASELAGVGAAALERMARLRPDALVTVTEAAKLLGLRPATVRSWVHRGHLRPRPAPQGPEAADGHPPETSGRSQLLFRLDDVRHAARSRTRRRLSR